MRDAWGKMIKKEREEKGIGANRKICFPVLLEGKEKIG
jgi:hypothetical protein